MAQWSFLMALSVICLSKTAVLWLWQHSTHASQGHVEVRQLANPTMNKV